MIEPPPYSRWRADAHRASALNGSSPSTIIKEIRTPIEVRTSLVPLTGLEPVQYRYRGILSFQFCPEMLVF